MGIGCFLRGIEGKVPPGGFDLSGVFVFVHSPAGNVELMRPLVADVAVSVVPMPVPVVMEAVAVERPLWCWAEPEVIMYIPGLCDDRKAPYIFVPSKRDLGNAAGIERPTAAVAIVVEGKAKDILTDVVEKIGALRK